MPELARACPHYGCPHPAPCPTHGRQAQQSIYDDRRGSASSRGYGARWQRHRTAVVNLFHSHELPRAGLCGVRLPGAQLTTDSECTTRNLTVRFTTLDHIIPVTGPDDPTFFEPTALQGLCSTCDARKRQRESLTGGGTHRAWGVA